MHFKKKELFWQVEKQFCHRFFMKIKFGLIRMLLILAAMGFLIFMIVYVITGGGDASNGKIENGHYYFGYRGDKSLSE
jgi:hypothetical protein